MEQSVYKTFSNNIDLLPCYAFSFSEQGYITSINLPFLDQLGYSRGEVVHMLKFTDLLTVGSRIFYQTHFYPLIKLHGKFNEIFLSFLTKNKEELPVLLNVSLHGDGETYEIQCAGIQIVQRNRFEKEILEAKSVAEKALLENEALIQLKQQLEKNQVLLESKLQKLAQKNHEQQQINTLLSHDFQEPVRKIALFTNKLATDDEIVLSPKAQDYFERINNAALKLREHILNIQYYLTLSEEHLNIQDVDLNASFKVAAEKAGIISNDPCLRLSILPMHQVQGDNELLTEMFFNLLQNSLKFRDEAKPILEIQISAEYCEQNIFVGLEGRYKYEEYLKITYSDNGIGFNETFNEEVFVLFRKAHDMPGSGIGLSFCRKIVDFHKGFISAKSKENEGATFTILLPAYSAT